LKKESKIGL